MITPTDEWNSEFLAQSLSDCLSPHDLNLNLYNFDKVDASNCPYVLTSPRSLEACANQGVKPVELLPKLLDEFRDELPQSTPLEEIKRRYKQYELARTRKLEKCRKERDYIIRTEKMRHRSQSLSPKGRRLQILEEPQLEVVLSSDEDQCASITTLEDSTTVTPCEDASSTRGADSQDTTDLSSATTTTRGEGDSSGDEGGTLATSGVGASSAKRKKGSGSRPTSKSTPTSPFRRPSQLVPIPTTSPLLKLVDNPRAKTKLPIKDMKLLELMLRRREQEDREAEERRLAHRAWDLEREQRAKSNKAAGGAPLRHTGSLRNQTDKRWRRSQPMTSSNSCELLDSGSCSSSKTPEEKMPSQVFSHLAEMKQCLEQASQRQLQHSKQKLRELQHEQEELQRQRHMEMERAYRRQLEDRIRQKEALFAERKRQRSAEKESVLRKSAEELEEKLEQVRLNQREMDSALDMWRERVADYQEAANLRARQRAQEALEFKKRIAQHERLLRQAEHQRNMHRVEMEESIRLQSMMERLREKEDKSRLHAQEKQLFIEQVRWLAPHGLRVAAES
ncbi:coiled-coil domain-containing protein 177 [Ixodes scapularis]